jgi:predicted GTPase
VAAFLFSGVIAMSENRQDGWQLKALTAALILLMALAGWVWTANTTAIRDNKEKQDATAEALQRVAERTAVQEEAVRNQKDTLQRIEKGIEELRLRLEHIPNR